MKVSKITKFAAIQEMSAEAFQDKMNDILSIAPNPQITFPEGTVFTAYITYEEEVKESVTAEDEYVDKVGDIACCGDCPYLEKSKDKRVKHHTCKYSEFPHKVDSRACELYYQRFFNGTL